MMRVAYLWRKLVLSAIFFTVLVPAGVGAETTECTVIESVPYVITTQGIYCLKGDLATSATEGFGIDIQANNVTIDFNGFKMGNLGGGTTSTMRGVYAQDRKNIVIKNANIRGFDYGIYFLGGSGHKVLNSNFDQCTLMAMMVHSVDGSSLVAENTITNIGGFSGLTFNSPSGIVVHSNADIRDNSITNVFNWGNTSAHKSYGIAMWGTGNVVEDNIVRGGSGSYTSIGISKGSVSGDNVIAGNKVMFLNQAYSLYAPDGGTIKTVFKDNTAMSCTENYFQDGTGSATIVDAGGNSPAIGP